MEQMPRHQCLIYDGSPSKMLPTLAAIIKKKLSENLRCFYLNSPTMMVGLRSYLFAAGVDVTYEVARGSLILSSEQNHLKNGHFDADQMLDTLEESMNQALNDGYKGLWATGDMTWELGPDKDLKKLLEYEWRLEKFMQKHPALSGICQYHAGTLPLEALSNGLLMHPAVFINETLARINPHYVSWEGLIPTAARAPELQEAILNLCALQRREEPNSPL
jgi:hypothetical protein